MVDQHVARSPDETNRRARLADQHAGDRRLHDAFKEQPVGVGMSAFDLKARHSRHPFPLPDLGPEAVGSRRFVVRAFEVKCRPRPCHDDLRDPLFAGESDAAGAREIDEDGRRQSIGAFREANRAVALGDGMADGLGVVGTTVTDGPELANGTHRGAPPHKDRGRRTFSPNLSRLATVNGLSLWPERTVSCYRRASRVSADGPLSWPARFRCVSLASRRQLSSDGGLIGPGGGMADATDSKSVGG